MALLQAGEVAGCAAPPCRRLNQRQASLDPDLSEDASRDFVLHAGTLAVVALTFGLGVAKAGLGWAACHDLPVARSAQDDRAVGRHVAVLELPHRIGAIGARWTVGIDDESQGLGGLTDLLHRLDLLRGWSVVLKQLFDLQWVIPFSWDCWFG